MTAPVIEDAPRLVAGEEMAQENRVSLGACLLILGIDQQILLVVDVLEEILGRTEIPR